MDTEPTVICSVILYKCHRHGFKDLESSVYIAMLTLPYFWGKQPDTGCIEEKIYGSTKGIEMKNRRHRWLKMLSVEEQ